MFDAIRVLRTPSSERFLLRQSIADFAAVDIHDLPDGRVSVTLVVFENGPVKEAQIPDLISQIDLKLLPDVSVENENVSFTVVVGRVVGAFSANEDEANGEASA